MSDWLHNLPVVWMALVVFGFTYLVAAAMYAIVTVLTVAERARSFKAISPGMLPPFGIIFGLFVVFAAAQVWTDSCFVGGWRSDWRTVYCRIQALVTGPTSRLYWRI